MKDYNTVSLQLHLFFARIMKEHAIFLEAGFLKPQSKEIIEAEWYKNQFENLFYEIIVLSNGVIDQKTLNSNEFFTDYTLVTEQETQKLTGIPINTNLTILEKGLQPKLEAQNIHLQSSVKSLNCKVLNLLEGFIGFKERLLSEVVSCRVFMANYPLLIEHILREAKLYYSYIQSFEGKLNMEIHSIKSQELFWNQIMMEHALFIRGLLDPTEEDLFKVSNEFAEKYKEILQKAQQMNDQTLMAVTNQTLGETVKYRDFKIAGTKGLSQCKIKSLILPLLADHVTREANHYIRILQEFQDLNR